VVDDRVAPAVAELYGGELEAFIERRKALVAAARATGDRGAATAIAALRKPTRAAWVVNRLARANPDAPARLAALAAALRAAEQEKDGQRLRELSAARGALIDALTAQALAAGSVLDPPTSLRDEVAATLTAALADPATAADFAAGTLTKAAHWSGFGAADLSPTSAASPLSAASPVSLVSPVSSADSASPDISPGVDALPNPRRPARRSSAAAPQQGGPGLHADREAAQAATRRAELQRRAAVAEQRAAAAEQQSAREAAERATERQKNYQEMERTLVSAATATAEAEAAEDRLELEVRDLEQRLTKAREDLAAARLRARHAEAAERRARQALDRLPRPS
jgi:hypothetical protein